MKDVELCIKKKLIKEFNYTDKLLINKCTPPIEEIIECIGDVCIKEKGIIKTCCGYKLLVKGLKVLKVKYVSNDCENKIRYKKYYIPFFETISISPCIKILAIDSKLTFCDIDFNKCDKIYFYNILCLSIIVAFNNSVPKICCIEDNICDDIFKFKNDCYPSSYTNLKENTCNSSYIFKCNSNKLSP